MLVMNSLSEKEGLKGKVQTIFLDPPYEFSNEDIENILTALTSSSLLAPAAIVAVERPARISAFAWPAGFTASKERKYGEALVYFASVSL